MLTDEERDRIRAEEVFRDEVRKSLDDKRSSRRGVAAVINSPFVIWLLSSVVIGLVSFGYTQCNASREERARTEKLRSELIIRLGRAMKDIELEKNNPNVTAGSIVNSLLSAPGSDRMNLAEFADRSFYAVFREWGDKTHEQTQARELLILFNDLLDLRNSDSSPESKEKLNNVLTKMSDVLLFSGSE